jgi:exopolysaccharide biosynthesis polyprenyl glycosylphosphotransferase
MQRAMAQYVPREMAVLGLVEVTLSFLVIYAMIQLSGAPAAVADSISRSGGDSVRLAALIALSIGGIGLAIGLYQPDVCRNRRRLLPATCLAAVLAFAVLLAFTGGLGAHSIAASALDTGRVFAVWLVTMAVIRLIHGLDVVQRRLVRRFVLLGDGAQIAACVGRLHTRRSRIFEPVTIDPLQLSWQWLRQHRVWGVVLLSGSDASTRDALLDCKLRGMPILSDAGFQERYLGRIDPNTLDVDDLLAAEGFHGGYIGAALKRGCDILMALFILALTLPLMLFVAVAIRLDSPGPIIYRQQRVGRLGRTFTVFKFRSMSIDAEACGRPRWAQAGDPRVTRVGRFIRATRIDELPQLANVLRGEMSMVGPRPERPLFVEQLAQAIPFYRQRAYVKPGLTGWAQVNYSYGASVEDAREKLAYDLYYVKHRSIWLDLIILLRTVRVVLFGEGAR